MKCYKDLTHFEAAGNITHSAFFYLWERADKLELLRISGKIVLVSTTNESSNELIMSKDRVESYFNCNPMTFLKTFDVPVTFASIEAATRFLELIPMTVSYVAMLTIVVTIADSTLGVAIGDAVAAVLRQMVEFKLACKKREKVKRDVNTSRARLKWVNF